MVRLFPRFVHPQPNLYVLALFVHLPGKIRDMLRFNRPVSSSSTALGRHAGTAPLVRPSLQPRAACTALGRCNKFQGPSALVRNRLPRRGARIYVFTPTRPMEDTAKSGPATEPPPNLPYRLAAEQQLRKWLGLRPEDIMNVVTVSGSTAEVPVQLLASSPVMPPCGMRRSGRTSYASSSVFLLQST